MRAQETDIYDDTGSCYVQEDSPEFALSTKIFDSIIALPNESPSGEWISNQFPHKMMLTLLTFAYASGIFSSEQIERRCATDPAFGSITDFHGPSATLIRSFRRGHRAQIEKALGTVWGLDVARSILNHSIMLDSVGSDI